MPSLRSLAVAFLLACIAPVALAQTALPAIEKQMTPEEFKAAGLDKLSAEELARLNAWLGRTLDTETAKAAAVAKAKGMVTKDTEWEGDKFVKQSDALARN